MSDKNWVYVEDQVRSPTTQIGVGKADPETEV